MRTFNASIGHSRKKVKPETSTSHSGLCFSTLSLDEKLNSIVTSVHDLSTKMSELTSILHYHNTRQDMKFTSLQTQLDQIQRQLEENMQLFHDKKRERNTMKGGDFQLIKGGGNYLRGRFSVNSLNIFLVVIQYILFFVPMLLL